MKNSLIQETVVSRIGEFLCRAYGASSLCYSSASFTASRMLSLIHIYVAAKIKKANPTAEKPFVLGLPTGSSPLGMYKNLIELNKQGVISFQNIITFNMDEYVGLPKDHPERDVYKRQL